MPRRASLLRDYLLALAIGVAAFGLQYFFVTELHVAAVGVLYPAAFLTAVLFGFGPALAEILLSGALGYFLFYNPAERTAPVNVRYAVFAFTSLLVCYLVEQRRRTRMRLGEMQTEAERVRRRLDHFFLSLPTPVAVLTGPDLRFELANPEYERLVGGPARQLIGRPVREAIPEIGPEIELILSGVLASGERFEGKEFPITLDWNLEGRPYQKFLNFTYEPLRNDAGKVEGILVFAYDVTDLVRARQAVQESEAQLRAYAEAMPQMAFIADGEGNLVYFNRRWYDYVGLRAQDTEGWNWQHQPIHHPDDLERTLRTWREALRTGREYEIEYRLRRHDGTYRWHLGRAVPVRDEQGRITRWYGTNTDIDDQKRIQEELTGALRTRDDFLSVAGHELRTPVTSLLLTSQLYDRQYARFGRDFFTEKRIEEMLNQSKRQAERLARLMEDILDVTRLGRDRVSLQLEPHDVAHFVHDVVDRLSPAFRDRKVPLTVTATEGARAEFDNVRLERALTNLLTNALRYGRATPVHVDATLDADGTLVIRVQDQGPGVAREDQERIFGRFERASAVGEGGLGLGLYICRELVTAHGGTLRLVSEPGAGALFEIRIPQPPPVA